MEQRSDELAPLPWTDDAKAAFLAGQFALQHRHFTAPDSTTERWIVEVDEVAAGRLYVDRARALWRLGEVTLAAAARGRGHGAALLGWLQAAARGAGAEGIDLHVLATNARAATLYARCGFVEADGGSPTHRRMLWRVS